MEFLSTTNVTVPNHVELIPGTEIMVDFGDQHFTKSRRGHIVLVPQPSTDPRDPFNWTPRWKFAAVASTIYVTFAQTLGPLAISPVFPQLMHDFDSSLEEVIQFTGITILLLGFGNWLWVPLCDTFGRRPVLLLSEIVTIIGAIWRATSTSYNSFYGASALLGIGTSMAIQPAIIADITFLHERGFYNTLFFATFFCGIILGPVLQGVMARVGWRSFWWLNTALNCVGLVVVIFGFPETMWERKKGPRGKSIVKDGGSHQPISKSQSKNQDSWSGRQNNVLVDESNRREAVTPSGSGHPEFRQFWPFRPNRMPFQQLAISFWVPFKLLMFPIIIWAGLVQSWCSSVYLSITFVQSVALTAPPYHFSTESVGFINFAALIGAFLGLLTAGPFSDWVSMKLTVRNGGIREAEMRLPAILPYALIMVLGNFVVGFGLQYNWNWRAIAVIGYGCAGIQATALSSIASTYAVDSYTPVAMPIFIIVTLTRDLWGFGVSHFITPWVMASGYVPFFMLNMCVLVLWLLMGGVLYFYGKSVRRLSKDSWVHIYHEAGLRDILGR